MTLPGYIREKVRELRVERRMSIDEIAERMALSRSTVYYIVRDLPLGRPRNLEGSAAGRRLGNARMKKHWAAVRKGAYEEGRRLFPALSEDRLFRDFVCLYIAEGYKRNRNRVSIANSDSAVLKVAEPWIQRFASNKIDYSLQYHADQDVTDLRKFWSGELDVAPEAILLQRKSNSNQLAGRTWRSKHGVMSVGANDTCFRAKLQAWIDLVREDWV